MVYDIQRTRLITERFRVEAENEEAAIDELESGGGGEQLELSTHYSHIDDVEAA